ncbi:hypothetical protein Taro_014448 [Colocasia esculenta]|uniref:Protein ecdysoneless homolog n=1 Tax=Colocasia esculenta TaxID=4460 RepID=A0A843ULT8_COLES|nr:hypothetical protein [Colocasia esculenta]
MELSTSCSAAARSSSSPLFPGGSRRPPEDTVFFSIFPDKGSSSFSSDGDSTGVVGGEPLFSRQLHILDTVLPHFLRDYIWQHEPFSLSPSSDHACSLCGTPAGIPHLHGRVRYGDNVEDEWFVVFLLYEVSRRVPWVSIRVWDSDGEFLLIEAAFSLPCWVNPESCENRVFVRRGELHILPRKQFPSNPTILEALSALRTGKVDTRAPEKVQEAINKRISGYPQRARMNMHRARIRVPLPVAQVLKQEPCLIALAVEGFYDRDVDSMKYAAKMERFLRSEGGGVDIVQTSVLMSRAMYGQLVQQNFVAPRCYPMPSRDQGPVLYGEAELGMKIACGFEMMYQDRRRAGEEGKGSSVDAFKKALQSHGYFEGLLPGSKEYRRRMDEALERHKNSIVFSRTRDTLGAPVRRIDEILSLPFSSSDFVGVDLPPSDDDSWLYDGEEELTSAILERQREIEVYESKRRGKVRSGDHKLSDNVPSPNDFDMGDMAKSMEAFMHKVSSLEGAEVPQSRDREVDLDVQQFIKDMESVLGPVDQRGISAGIELGEGETSSSDMDFDESEDESNSGKESEVEDSKYTFTQSYSDALYEELKGTTLKTSFIHAQQFSDNHGELSWHSPCVHRLVQGSASKAEDVDEELTPVDVDINLVKSFIDSFSSQQGLPGPASNLLGLMGLRIPQDDSKGTRHQS